MIVLGTSLIRRSIPLYGDGYVVFQERVNKSYKINLIIISSHFPTSPGSVDNFPESDSVQNRNRSSRPSLLTQLENIFWLFKGYKEIKMF